VFSSRFRDRLTTVDWQEVVESHKRLYQYFISSSVSADFTFPFTLQDFADILESVLKRDTNKHLQKKVREFVLNHDVEILLYPEIHGPVCTSAAMMGAMAYLNGDLKSVKSPRLVLQIPESGVSALVHAAVVFETSGQEENLMEGIHFFGKHFFSHFIINDISEIPVLFEDKAIRLSPVSFDVTEDKVDFLNITKRFISRCVIEAGNYFDNSIPF
jgi:hypothetical protein